MDYPLPHVSHDLTGRVAIVTGSSAGMGVRFARTLAAAGAKVAVTGRRQEKVDAVVTQVRAEGGAAEGFVVDVSDAEQALALPGRVEASLGLVDILVNNAGIPDAQRAHKMPLELIDAVLNTNLRGPYLLSCEVARRLIAAKQPGRIVNISSMGATWYAPGGAAALYSITKAGISRMTEVLAVEWSAYGINVNAIAPGAFASEMMSGMIERVGDDFIQAYPRKRLGDPAQLDSTLLYLVSPASEAVTGAIIKVDDGQRGR